jgi:hypothetical protein
VQWAYLHSFAHLAYPLTSARSEVADRAMSFLERHRADLAQRGDRWVAAMRAEMVECAYIDAAALGTRVCACGSLEDDESVCVWGGSDQSQFWGFPR